MNFPYKTIGVVPKLSYQGIEELMSQVADWLKRHNSRVLCLDDVFSDPNIDCVNREVFEKESDLIMVLGGDGTFLGAGKMSLHGNIPILGVNLGRLGFLTEVTLQELFSVLEKIEKGDFQIEERPLLEARIVRDRSVLFEAHVINDAVVAKSAIARMLELETRVNDNFLALFKADGLIISTPTGSTAYSLAAGGPIVFPTMEAIILTPICPHSLNHRPLVIPDNFTISVHTQSRTENVCLTLDGQISRSLYEGEHIEVARSHHHLRIIKSPFRSYFDVLKSKLRWGGH